ncbi:reverse transcriptase domain-containing protein [Artemisia annua]|uniref:Reverse transcriptase domain-containing protein n=1 Tax=Artemisia annua TaxID=35608 RepID=A0A2U1QGQ4_ARTAN|nr:reverse transcriptase domain-containing protein [Artemisia annua]
MVNHMPDIASGHIHIIESWQPGNKRSSEVMEDLKPTPSRNIPWDSFLPSFDPVVILTMIASYKVSRIYVDRGMYEDCFNKLPVYIRRPLSPLKTSLISFSSERSYPEGVISLELTFEAYLLSRTIMMDLHSVKSASKYNVLTGRPAPQKLNIEVSTNLSNNHVNFTTKFLASNVTLPVFMVYLVNGTIYDTVRFLHDYRYKVFI